MSLSPGRTVARRGLGGPGVDRGILRGYGFAWCYLALYVIAEVVYVSLSPGAQAALIGWATTSVANLEREPAGPLIVSAFIGPGEYLALPLLIALAVLGANRALGTARTMLICVAGHVIGTLVSEGIVAYRIDAGQLPVGYRHLEDVGPSYIVMSAIVIALVCGTRWARLAAAFDLGILVFIGDAFGGLSHLDVPAVGHLTAAVTAMVSVAVVLVRRRAAQARPAPAAAVPPSADTPPGTLSSSPLALTRGDDPPEPPVMRCGRRRCRSGR